MNKDKLQQLANMAIVREYITQLRNTTQRSNLKLIDIELKNFDAEFITLFLQTCKNEDIAENVLPAKSFLIPDDAMGTDLKVQSRKIRKSRDKSVENTKE